MSRCVLQGPLYVPLVAISCHKLIWRRLYSTYFPSVRHQYKSLLLGNYNYISMHWFVINKSWMYFSSHYWQCCLLVTNTLGLKLLRWKCGNMSNQINHFQKYWKIEKGSLRLDKLESLYLWSYVHENWCIASIYMCHYNKKVKMDCLLHVGGEGLPPFCKDLKILVYDPILMKIDIDHFYLHAPL